MNKKWWFESKDRLNKKNAFLKLWKGTILWILLIWFLSFFSILNDFVSADRDSIVNKLSSLSDLKFANKTWLSPHIWKIIKDYKDWKNILKNNDIWLSFLEENIETLISVLWYWKYKKQILYIYNKFKPFKGSIYEILWRYEAKNYLLIFQNTSEERPDWGFFWSFASFSFDWWHLKNFKIYDSYYLLWSFCQTSWDDWFDKCPNRSKLSIKNKNPNFLKLRESTTFLSSNIYAFTDLNWESVIRHYNQVFPEKIAWVIFLKSDILKYLIPDWYIWLRKMELLNALGKSAWTYKHSDAIKWLWWAKHDYLKSIQNNLINKKQIFENFLKNYKKIVKKSLIRVYLPDIDNKFKNFLVEENLNFKQESTYAYLFFYNMWFNKNSKFVDHIVKVNDRVYLNPDKFELLSWTNLISFKNVWNDDHHYWEFLESHNVPKDSYLRDKSLNYRNTLIVPKNCEVKNETKTSYRVKCF